MPTKIALSYNRLLAVVFIAGGILALVAGIYPIGIALLCLGVSFALLGNNTQAWSQAPRWRKAVTLGLQGIAAVLLVAYIITSSK